MNQSKRLVLSFLSGSFITLLILAVLGLQFLEVYHVHSDGEDHSDCSLCQLSGNMQAAHIDHALPAKPFLLNQEIFQTTDLFPYIYFHGFLYTPCGPPQA